jgi:type IV fimbrial biogenesis protein FimT
VVSALSLPIHAARRAKSPDRGFTLVELMVVLVIVSAMLGIGVPLFETFILDQRTRATSSDLRVALSTARSEAVKRNRVVGLQPAPDGWSDGWTIPSPEPGDPDLLVHNQPGEVTITGPAEVQFSPMGRVAAPASFEIRAGAAESGHESCLQVQTDGRVAKVDCPEEV